MLTPTRKSLSTRRILRTWWPLAGSWLLMTTELPMVSAVIARLAEPEINLAAWGVVFSVAVIIQSPSTMMLAASTALSKDSASYQKLHRYTWGLMLVLSSLHALLAFTPLYDLVIINMLGLPEPIIEPVRLGMMIMTFWSAGTAYRRFQQGVLIRFDHSLTVVWGSFIRIGADLVILLGGYLLGGIPGIAVGTAAVITGVISEAVYTGFRVRPVLRTELVAVSPVKPALNLRIFLTFYVPLALMMLLTLIIQPMVSGAISRMPHALESLAVWPALYGLLLMWQSAGISFNEAVIALLDHPYAVPSLRRFSGVLVGVTTGLLLVMAATPLSTFWFSRVAGLPPELVQMARTGLWLGLPLPALRVLLSWYQGTITYSQSTRGITEAVVIFLATSSLVLGVGILWGEVTGLFVGVIAMSTGFLMQSLWLWYRARPVLRAVEVRDNSLIGLQTAMAGSKS